MFFVPLITLIFFCAGYELEEFTQWFTYLLGNTSHNETTVFLFCMAFNWTYWNFLHNITLNVLKYK